MKTWKLLWPIVGEATKTWKLLCSFLLPPLLLIVGVMAAASTLVIMESQGNMQGVVDLLLFDFGIVIACVGELWIFAVIVHIEGRLRQ